MNMLPKLQFNNKGMRRRVLLHPSSSLIFSQPYLSLSLIFYSWISASQSSQKEERNWLGEEKEMSGKFSTLILKVDLGCCQCNRKIKKLLCKIQDRENIKLIAYDEKNNTVTISGPFDPHCLKRKLLCKACKIIKEIHIKEDKPPPPPPPAEQKKPDPPPPEKKPDPPPPEKKPDPPPPEKKPDPPPPEKKPDPPPPAKKPEPPGPVCCARPCYVGMYGGTKCASCGMVYSWTNQGPPTVMVYSQPPVPPGYYYGGGGCGCGCGSGYESRCPKTYQFICEDNTSQCTIM